MISIDAHHVSIGSFYNRLKHFSDATKKAFAFRYDSAYSILVSSLVLLLYLPTQLHLVFALVVLVTSHVVNMNSVRFKCNDCSYHLPCCIIEESIFIFSN